MTQTGTGKYERLLERCRGREPIPTAVAWPCEETALAGALDAAREGMIRPIRVGPAGTIRELAKAERIPLGDAEIVDVAESHAAATKGVALVREGKAELLMKGSLHSDEILGAVVSKEGGLRTGRRLSHVFLMDVPTYHKVLIVTDGAIDIAAVEVVNSRMPATLDAAALCKMAERGQIKGGVLDGPLAFDDAISRDAAKIEGITSEVAGDPDILLAPDLEAGNMSLRSRVASTAVAVLAAHARRQPPR